MPSLNLLVVGEEKALPDFEDALESCKRYVGPIKLFTAHKAVDAVSRLQKLVQTCGQCHAAFLSHHFTCPGKEEFSETLRKVIKEKYPDVPVICWGAPKKGGDLNKHYHATLEFAKHGGDVNAVVDILKQVQAGQIRAEYLHKDQRKSLERRNSLERTDSIRGAPRTDSLLRRTDSRRASNEGSRPAALDHAVSSSRRSLEADDREVAVMGGGGVGGGMQSIPTLRRKSMERRNSMDAQGGGMYGSGPLVGAMSGSGMGGLANMGSMSGGMGMSGMGMSGMGGGMTATGSLNNGMAMGMGGMGMGGMGGGMMATGSLNNGMAMGMGGGMGPAAMGGMVGSMNARMGMGMMPGANMGGNMMGDVNGMMGNMSLSANGAPPAAAAAAAPVPAAAGAGGGGNGELIRMLAEEVVRLRKAVEEKRSREAEAAATQQQLLELQQQQLLLQQQLAAGGVGMGVGVGVMGGGMPMGI